MKYLWEHPLLYFHSKEEVLLKDKVTIHTKDKKQYKGIIFQLTQKELHIQFKPHYFYNNNEHNANDFSIVNCIKTLKEFIKIFKLDAKLLHIINIEFGLNIVLPIELICIKELLLILAYHDKNQFYSDKKFPFMYYSTTVNANGSINEYKIIKAYAKGIQFPTITDINTFRFEVKSNRKGYINKLGIYTLNDLLNADAYLILENTILSEFDNVLILDDTITPDFSTTKLKTHKKRLTLIYWHRLMQKSRNLFRRCFNDYYVNLNTCETHLKKEIRKLISSKLRELKKCAILNPYIGEIRTPFLNICLVTGLNISMQRNDSNLLSHTGLRYYLKTDKKIYEELVQKHLPKKWNDADDETQLKELAHNIRTIETTRKRKQSRLYNDNQFQLFEAV